MSQIVYFPYMGMKNLKELSFGDLNIWNFDELANDKILDLEVREYVGRLIKANKESDGQSRSVSDIGIVSIGKTDFRQFSFEEEKFIQEAKLCLFLSRIAITNTTIMGSGSDGWPLATSENLEPVYQNFELGVDHISERAGVIAPIGIGGYRVSEKRFYKPSHVLISPYGFRYDSVLLRQLENLKVTQKRLYSRILRAIELVFQSYYNSPTVSYNSRILLMASAFETLLNLEEPARKNFKDAVELYCDVKGEPKYRHYYATRQGKKRDKDRSIKVLWADSFFQLRNNIIHGESLSRNMFYFKVGDRQHDISILFFCMLVKMLINEKLKSTKFLDTITWGVRKDKTEGFIYNDRSFEVRLNEKLEKM